MEPFLIVIVVVGIIIFQVVRYWRTERMIEQYPIVQVPATVITTYSFQRRSSPGHTRAQYVIFELKTGERKQFEVEYLQLAEGMKGLLTYQGSRLLNFQY
jgi:hypothetical protein